MEAMFARDIGRNTFMDEMTPQVTLAEFQPTTIDKVKRLLELLEEIERHPRLKGKLSMHGGTAINLFMLDVPRLSVDLDLSYVGKIERDEMLEERPYIEQALREVAEVLGYSVTGGEDDHAGRSLMLNYRGIWGHDHVKIDIVYLNRSPLLPVHKRPCVLMPSLEVTMFVDYELIGGKVKAFFERVKVRDLYDVANLNRLLRKRFESDVSEEELAHQIILYYASISARFPNAFEGRAKERFAHCEDELQQSLYPMLRQNIEKPTLGSMIEEAERFITDFVLPRTDNERLYLERFAQGVYEPTLLFGNAKIAVAASLSPEAQWKLLNIKKMRNS